MSLIRRALWCALPAVIVAFVSVSPQASAEDSWPTFRGPDGTGRAVEVLPPGEGPLALEVRWKRDLGSGYSGVSLGEGLLVTLSEAGERNVVVAFDPDSGEERWRYDLAPAYPGHDGSADGAMSTPAIADGRAFVLGPWGHVAALDLKTGAALWTVHLVDDLGSEKPLYGFASSPVVAGDTVVLGIGGKAGTVAGFDAATGALRWRSVEDQIFSQSAVVADLAGRRQVLVLGGKTLVGLDPVDGTVLWSIEHGASQRNIMGSLTQSPLVVGEDRVLVKQDDSAVSIIEVSAGEGGLTATRVYEGRGLHRSYSPPTVWEGQAYGYTNRLLSALDLETGELLWRSRDPGDGFLVAVDGHLAVLTKEGSLHLGPASPDGWEETASLQVFEEELAWTPPSVGRNVFYLRSLSELARVDIVRAGAAGTGAAGAGGDDSLPSALAPLVAELKTAGDPVPVVDRFLAGRDLPLIDGEDVVFLWRGEAQDVAVAGEMIGIRREEAMRRLEGTDLWWWSTTLDRRARISYLFFVDYAPTPDPAHARRAWSTAIGPDMNWNRGEPMEVSWFAMPEWPGRALDFTEAPEPRGRLEKVEVALTPPGEDAEPVAATVQVWLPPGYDDSGRRYPVVFVHDEHAREVGRWVETLDRVVGLSVEPVIVAFVEPPPMPGYIPAFGAELAPAIDARFRTSRDRDDRANVGMGFWAQDAAIATFQNPESFGLLGIQSYYAVDEMIAGLLAAVGDQNASAVPVSVYLEWGRWDLWSPHEEFSFRESSLEVWDLLSERGWQPMGGEVWDSSDFASWSNRTDVLLESLFPIEGGGASPRLARWSTGQPGRAATSAPDVAGSAAPAPPAGP